MTNQCDSYPLDLNTIDTKKLAVDMKVFCSKFRANKVKEYTQAFLALPLYVQCLFAYYCHFILSKKMMGDTSISDSTFIAGQRLNTLFKNHEIRLRPEVRNIINKFDIRKEHIEFAKTWNKQGEITVKPVFEKTYQKKITPNNEDPLFRFYSSLYDEKPNSKIAIIWLTEHGAFDDQKRIDLVKRYTMIQKK